MDMIIGRDGATSRLNVIINQSPKPVGTPQSVPKSVSRQHCIITIDDDGGIRIKNINPQNVTYVNGVAVMSKVITKGDKVELGADRYLLSWKLVEEAMPKVADISDLQNVWDTYNYETKAIAQSTQRFQVVRGIVPVLTMSAVLIGYLSGGRGGAFYLIYLLVIALTIFFSWKAWKDIANNDERREDIKDSFTRNYCCPNCGYFFGFQDYRILTRNMDNCPKCKATLKK